MIIPLPPMTRQVRLENQKKVNEMAERQKTMIRNIREKQIKSMRNALKEDPGLGKDALHKGEKDVDKQTKASVEDIDKITEQLKKDIMSI
jgi:ribosome recycling factor